MQGCALSTFSVSLQMQNKQKRNFICQNKAFENNTGSENYLMKNFHG